MQEKKKGSNYFPVKKSKLIFFFFSNAPIKQNCKVYITEHQNLKIIFYQILFSKYFWGIFCFISEPILIFFMNYGLQKDDIDIFKDGHSHR